MKPAVGTTSTVVREGSAGDAGSERDLQRTALRELVELADASARKEREIEERYRGEVEGAKADLERALWLVEQRHNSLREGTKEKHDLRNLEIERQLRDLI